VGYRIAKSSVELAAIAEGILYHHENWDGTGYPEGKRGKDIPYLARIISIIDFFDTMVNDQPYRKAISKEDAIDELRRYSGTKYDPKLVEVFIKSIK